MIYFVTNLGKAKARDVTVKGYVHLPRSFSGSLPAGSCLHMSIQENVQCEYCVNPILAETRIVNPSLEGNRIAYRMTLSDNDEDSYIIQATINVGWCRSENESLKIGDYHNEYSYDFNLASGDTEVDKDLNVVRYSKTGGRGILNIF